MGSFGETVFEINLINLDCQKVIILVAPYITKIEYSDIGKCSEKSNDTFVKIDDENITIISFAAEHDFFYFQEQLRIVRLR